MSKNYCRDFFLIFMSVAVMNLYRASIWIIMSIINDPIYPVKTLWIKNMYVRFTASRTIFLRSTSILWWLSCMWRALVCSSRSCKNCAILDCRGTVSFPPRIPGRIVGHGWDDFVESVSHDNPNATLNTSTQISCKGGGIATEKGQNVMDYLLFSFTFDNREGLVRKICDNFVIEEHYRCLF